MPVVMIMDQQRSRDEQEDRVPGLVATLNGIARDDLIMPFQRTIGDECEGVLRDAREIGRLVAAIARSQRWWIGIGVGTIDGVAPDSRDVSGEAFGIARDMVERAKRRTRRGDARKLRKPWPIRFAGSGDTNRDDAIESCLAAIHMIVTERSPREAEISQLLAAGELDQRHLSAILGISQPAISKAISRAHWDQEQALIRAVATMGADVGW